MRDYETTQVEGRGVKINRTSLTHGLWENLTTLVGGSSFSIEDIHLCTIGGVTELLITEVKSKHTNIQISHTCILVLQAEPHA